MINRETVSELHARICDKASPMAVFIKMDFSNNQLVLRTCKTNTDLFRKAMNSMSFVLVGVYDSASRVEWLYSDIGV